MATHEISSLIARVVDAPLTLDESVDDFSVVCSRRVHERRKEVLNYDLYEHNNHGECAEAENNHQQPLISMWNDLFIEWGG